MVNRKHHTIEEVDEDRMSSPEEETGEEERPLKKLPNMKTLMGFWQIGAKILELGLCILCISLIMEPIKRISRTELKYLHQLLLISATFIGYIIINTVNLLGRLFGDRLSYKTSALFSIIAIVLNLASGCIILNDTNEFSRKYIFHPSMYLLEMMTASGSFALVNMIVYALDAFFTLKYRDDL